MVLKEIIDLLQK